MELLTTTFVIVLLTTASAKPISLHYDADIADNGWKQAMPGGNTWWSWLHSESSTYVDSSSESDQSLETWLTHVNQGGSSENESSEDSSEEVVIPEQTTPMGTTAEATVSSGGGLIVNPGTISTDAPTVTEKPASATPTPHVVVTSPISVTDCVTLEIPTGVPITDNRGDN